MTQSVSQGVGIPRAKYQRRGPMACTANLPKRTASAGLTFWPRGHDAPQNPTRKASAIPTLFCVFRVFWQQRQPSGKVKATHV